MRPMVLGALVAMLFTPAIAAQDGPAEWTHLRVFRVRNTAAADALSGALDAATKKLRSPDEQKAASGPPACATSSARNAGRS